MKSSSIRIIILFLSLGITQSAQAEVTVQQLNTQLQAQLKQIQDTQNAQMIKLNAQFQTQLQQMQKQLQEQIQKLNDQTQTQIHQVQNALQQQIAQVQKEIIQKK